MKNKKITTSIIVLFFCVNTVNALDKGDFIELSNPLNGRDAKRSADFRKATDNIIKILTEYLE